MTHDSNLLFTLAGGLGAALFFGFATQKLKMSPIVGYLLAGIAVGPHTPGFVAHGALASELAELGVILLMFGVGLHFHVEDLLSVRRAVLPGAIVQVAASALAGVALGKLVGMPPASGAVLGLAVSTASTVVVLRVLTDAGAVQKPEGHVVIGWLLVQDVATVLVLVLLPVVAGDGTGGPVAFATIAKSSAIAVAKLGALVAFTAVVGRRAIPMLLGYVAKTRSRELFTLTVLVLALGIAVGSAELFGASMALGAFLAGVVVGQSTFSARAASEAMPMKDAFAVLFFVSVGMMLDPAQIWPNRGLVAVLFAIVMVVNPAVAYVATRLRRTPFKIAITLALALGQIGEFSFMLGTLGQKLGLLPPHVLPCLVAVSILTITVNPLVFRLVGPIVHAVEKRRTLPPEPPAADGEGKKHRAVVVGYGPVGRTLVKLLSENGVEPTVIEMNHETVARLNQKGIRAVYGDAARKEILESAGIHGAESLVVAASGSPADVIDAARAENPSLRVLSRATYLSEVESLTTLGANNVVTAEAEVALAMAEHILVRLGATPEQLDKTRDALRTELIEDTGPKSRGLS